MNLLTQQTQLNYTEWMLGVWLRRFSPTCAVHIEKWEGW